ncbi:thioesterase [Rhodococcoides trifolii]|uniref:Thioesterase n=1 Tax=Rhodococcoides trifolii TaxID=908250 RepID=A0A917CW97_9NOCA|nr:acyl-CoA thioesterase [Rhodococcus trifolii]GGG01930.1 thioesterase [Rhodococcus trifolii]
MSGATFTAHLQVRWADSDRLGHVNNVRYVEYAQEARVQFLSRLDDRGATVVRRLEVDYLHPVTDNSGPLEVEVSVTRVGTTSCHIQHVVKDRNGRVCAEVVAVMVGFESETETSRPWSDAERSLFDEFSVASEVS